MKRDSLYIPWRQRRIDFPRKGCKMAHDAHGEKAMARSRSNWEKELASIDKTLLDLLNRRARFCHQTHRLERR